MEMSSPNTDRTEILKSKIPMSLLLTSIPFRFLFPHLFLLHPLCIKPVLHNCSSPINNSIAVESPSWKIFLRNSLGNSDFSPRVCDYLFFLLTDIFKINIHKIIQLYFIVITPNSFRVLQKWMSSGNTVQILQVNECSTYNNINTRVFQEYIKNVNSKFACHEIKNFKHSSPLTESNSLSSTCVRFLTQLFLLGLENTLTIPL